MSQGKNPSDNLNCLSKALDAIGSSGVRFLFTLILMLITLNVLGVTNGFFYF